MNQLSEKIIFVTNQLSKAKVDFELKRNTDFTQETSLDFFKFNTEIRMIHNQVKFLEEKLKELLENVA